MELEQNFTKLYEAHADAIFRFVLLKTRNRQEALDITQDAFMKTWRYMSDGNIIKNARSFLYKTAYTTFLNTTRKRTAISLDTLKEDGWEPVDEETVAHPEAHAVRSEEHVNVMRAVMSLPDPFRDVLLLRYVDELSVKEIAEITGEKENTISVRIHRALVKLKESYE